VDLRGTTEFVNERAARLFGATPGVVAGLPYLDFVPPACRGNAAADHEAMLRGETVKREIVMRRPDGAEVWINLSWTALRDAEGRVAGGVGLFVDVTEHRRAREQLLQAQKMEAVGRLASGVAHDFNNLLVSILSCSTFLLESLDPDDARREEAAEIKKAGERAAQLVRQLLAFGRKSAFRPVPVDVNASIHHVEAILRRAAGESVALSISGEASWPTRIDPSQLEQVLLNLAVNARDAMPAGGHLRISTRNASLDRAPGDAGQLAPGRYTVITVCDTGGGIPPEVLPRIFEPFFTTKPEGRGTGLGLSTVYGIIQEAGGTVTVTSAVGRGSMFTIYLPACAEGPASDAPDPPRALARGGCGETVLVVEDEPPVRRVTRKMLEAHGFRVLEAGSAAEALRRVKEDDAVDLVLTDVVMPHMSGTELAAAVGAVKPHLPLVLMSGYADAQRSPPPGRNVVQKPFTADALLASIHEALGRARAAARRTA
jgi:PAS domain S-box-containing protein